MPIRASSVAISTSASSKIMRGDLPPNSSETTFKLLVAAACITIRPTSVEPVKLTYKIKKTSLWLEQSTIQYSTYKAKK